MRLKLKGLGRDDDVYIDVDAVLYCVGVGVPRSRCAGWGEEEWKAVGWEAICILVFADVNLIHLEATPLSSLQIVKEETLDGERIMLGSSKQGYSSISFHQLLLSQAP